MWQRASSRDGIKGLLIASPANPTGTHDRAARGSRSWRRCALSAACSSSPTRSTTGSPTARAPRPRLAYSDEAIVVNSFSKYFSMTGWRIGWMVVPQRLVRAVERLAQNLYIAPPAIAQAAALGAFDGMDELEANHRVYAAEPRASCSTRCRAPASRSSRPPTAPSTSIAT